MDAVLGLTVSERFEKVVAAGSSLVTNPEGRRKPVLTQEQAVVAVSTFLNDPAEISAQVLGLAFLPPPAGSGRLTLVYVVDADIFVPIGTGTGGFFEGRRFYVDAAGGAVLRVDRLTFNATIGGEVRGPVFPAGDPVDPVEGLFPRASLHIEELRPAVFPFILDAFADEEGLFEFAGLPEESSFEVIATLVGDSVRWLQHDEDPLEAVGVVDSDGVVSLLFEPADQLQTGALNVYWWLEQHRNHLIDDVGLLDALVRRTIGFEVQDEICAAPCNAAWSPGTDRCPRGIYFSPEEGCASGVDPALDRDLVLHEHGHDIQRALSAQPIDRTGLYREQAFELDEALSDIIALYWLDDPVWGEDTYPPNGELRSRFLENDFTTDTWSLATNGQGRETYAGALWDAASVLGRVNGELHFYEALQMEPTAATGEGALLNFLAAADCDLLAGSCEGGLRQVASMRQRFRDHGIGADVLIRDNSDDVGDLQPFGFAWWESPDICVEPCLGEGDAAIVGFPNDVRVTFRGLDNSYGPEESRVEPTVENLAVHLYWAFASTDPVFPDDYTEVGTSPATIDALGPDELQVVTFSWTPPSEIVDPFEDFDFCLLVRLVSPCDADGDGTDCDPITDPDNHPFNDNNIASKNILAVEGRAFALPGFSLERHVIVPNRTLTTGLSALDLELAGQPLGGIALFVPPDESREVNVVFTFVEGPTAQGLDVLVRLEEAADPNNADEVLLPADLFPEVLDVVHRIGEEIRGGVSFEVR